MFLHSGASLHGHEYSNRPAPAAHQQIANKRSPLLRSAFAAPKPRPISLDGAAKPPTTQVRRPLSECLPSLPEAVVRFLEPVEKETLQTPMTEDVASIMSSPEYSDTSFSEAPTAVGTSSSAEGVIVTAPSSPKRKKRRASSRASRKTTRYALAYPPPKRGHNVRFVQKIAPRVLLQLQEVSANERPNPVIDVFPSSWLAGPLIAPRLAKRFPALFGPKRELSSADVILVQSEDYSSEDVDSGDEEKGFEDKEPLAVLSPVKKSGRTEIALEGGLVWVAQPHSAKGNFDFVCTDAQGNTTRARWVRRSASKSPKQAPAAESSKAGQSTPVPPDTKYTFSIINPASRRHPIMATLTPSFLEIQDSYKSVSTSSSRYPPSRPLSRSLTVASQQHSQASSSRDTSTSSRPPLNRSVSSSAAEQGPASRTVQTPEPDAERTSHPVDECTRLLISVTAVFIALESGWSPFYKSQHANHAPDSALAAVAGACKTAARDRRKSSCDHSDTLSSPLSLKRGVSLPLPGPSRTAAGRDLSPIPSIAAPKVPPAWWESAHTPSGSGGGPSTLPTSTGAAFMKRTRMASVQHQHAPAESSDSENPSSSRRRSRILTGGSGKKDKGKGKAVDRPGTAVTPSAAPAPAPDIAPAKARAVGSNGNKDAVPNVKDTEGKTQNGSHPVSPPVVTGQAENGVELVAMGRGPQVVPQANGQHLPHANGNRLPPANGHHVPPANATVAGGRATGFTGKVKRLGHWFRRLGHGHGHGHPH